MVAYGESPAPQRNSAKATKGRRWEWKSDRPATRRKRGPVALRWRDGEVILIGTPVPDL